MDAITAIHARRSGRVLTEPAPSGGELDAILTAAAAAPDHGRHQPRHFVVIKGAFRGRGRRLGTGNGDRERGPGTGALGADGHADSRADRRRDREAARERMTSSITTMVSAASSGQKMRPLLAPSASGACRRVPGALTAS